MSSNPEKVNLKRKKQQEEQEKQKKSSVRGRIIAIVSAVLVVVLVAGMIYMNTDAFMRNLTAVTIGSEKISAAEFNYYYTLTFSNVYNSISNTYGSDMVSYFVDTSESLKTQNFSSDQTWHEYICEQTEANLRSIVMLCEEGEKAGYTLTADQQTELDSQLAEVSTSAESSGVSVNTYLETLYGKGVNLDVYTDCLTNTYYANCYSESVSDGISLGESDYQAAYEADPDNYDQVTFRAFAFTADTSDSDSDEDTQKGIAKTKADAMAEALNAAEDKEQAFIDLALENAEDSAKENYEDPDYTLSQYVMKSTLSDTYTEWLFDSSRVSGDVTVIEAGSSYYVLLFQERITPDYGMISVRHILLKPGDSDDSDSETTDADWETCLQDAEALLEEWKNGDATEDSFAALALKRTEDTSSQENGGLYANVYKGEMVKAFNDWCFDESRQPGDTGIVKTSYGYHVMYFVGNSDKTFLDYRADSLLRSEQYNTWEESALENYTITLNSFGMKRVGR